MPELSFSNLLWVCAIAFIVPLLLGLFPPVRIPAVVLEIVAGIVVAVAVACRSVRAEPTWASASAAIATAASTKIERVVSCLIFRTPF